MDNPKNGTTQADGELSTDTQAPKMRSYKTPNGDSFQITEEEFKQVVEIFSYLRRLRDKKDAQADALEPELSGLPGNTPVNWKVG